MKISDAKNISSKPVTLWSNDVTKTIIHPPIAIGNILLVATQESGIQAKHGTLHALNLTDGTASWKHDFDYAIVNGMQEYFLHTEQEEVAVVSLGSSDILKGEGGILAFNQSGEVIWQWTGTTQQYSAPLVRDRQVFVTAGAKQLVVISPEEEGDVERHIQLEIRASLAAPAVQDGVAYIPCRAPELLAVELNGTVRWHFDIKTSKRDHLNKTPIVTIDTVYIVSDTGSLLAIERDTGQLIWQEAVGNGRSLSDPAFFEQFLYVGMRSGLVAINAQNGKTVWQFKTERPISSRPLIMQELIFVSCEDHFVYALDRIDGQEKWRTEMNRRLEVPPILTSNALIIADRGGKIVALERPFSSVEIKPTIEDVSIISKRQRGQKEAFAKSYIANEQHAKAAEIWHELGELENAAKQYELANEWDKAADLWQQLDHYGKRAFAYQNHAKYVCAHTDNDEKKAIVWEQAARAFAETGQKTERLHCEREVARYREQPIINLEIKPKPLELNAWADLFIIVRNEGFGVARFVSITPKGDRFESQAGKTLTTPTLTPNRDFEFWFVVRPQQHGSRVPIQLIIEFMDKVNQTHKLERTFFLDVASESSLPTTRPVNLTKIVPQTGQLAELDAPEGVDLVQLYRGITRVFTREELTIVLFELNLRDDNFDSRLDIMTKELLQYLLRMKRLDELILILKKERPLEEW